MSEPRPLNSARLQADSLPDLVEGLDLLARELDEAGIKHEGRKLGTGPLLNALIAFALLLRPGQRRTFARAIMAALATVRRYPKVRRDWEVIRDGDPCPEEDLILRALIARKPKAGLALGGSERGLNDKNADRFSDHELTNNSHGPRSRK